MPVLDLFEDAVQFWKPRGFESRFRAEVIGAPLVYGAGTFIIPFDTEIFDGLDEYDPVTGFFTPTVSGYYAIMSDIDYLQTAGAGAMCGHSLAIGGVGGYIIHWDYPPLNTRYVAHLNGIFYLAAGTTVGVYTGHAVVGNLTVQNAPHHTFFSAHRLS